MHSKCKTLKHSFLLFNQSFSKSDSLFNSLITWYRKWRMEIPYSFKLQEKSSTVNTNEIVENFIFYCFYDNLLHICGFPESKLMSKLRNTFGHYKSRLSCQRNGLIKSKLHFCVFFWVEENLGLKKSFHVNLKFTVFSSEDFKRKRKWS